MRLLHCQCGEASARIDAPTLRLDSIPTRQDLRPLDELAAQLIGVDDSPSLAEIQASPSVSHLGAPQPAAQHPIEPLRVIVSGNDAALGAVLTRMMRADYMWVEVAYLPSDPTSPAALQWGNPTVEQALTAPVVPSPCIRNDFGEVVAGSATLSHTDPSQEFLGEIVVDSSVLVLRTGDEPSATFFGSFGAKLVPTPDAPGLAAAEVVTPLETSGKISRHSAARLERLRQLPGGAFLTRNAGVHPGQTDGSRVLTGRALQAGGRDIQVIVDGVKRSRGVEKATFYRHLRDIQSVKVG